MGTLEFAKQVFQMHYFQHSGVSQKGFSILEVLIALVVLSLGVLGAVGMQAAALKSNKEARYQAVAAVFAKELAEKMRGNHAVAIQTTAANNPYLVNTLTTPFVATVIPDDDKNCFKNACASGSIVSAWDMFDWQTRLETALPSPRVVVCFDATPYTTAGLAQWACSNTGDTVVVKMSWTRSNTAGTLEFATATTEPQIVIPLTAGSSE